MESLKLSLVTPLKKVFEDVEVSEIRFPAEKGELTVYPDHSPLVTTLDAGVLSYKPVGGSEFKRAVLSWGYCEVIDGKVMLLAETAQSAEQIDVEKAKAKKDEAEKALSSNSLAPEEILEMQSQLKLALAQLEVKGS